MLVVNVFWVKTGEQFVQNYVGLPVITEVVDLDGKRVDKVLVTRIESEPGDENP